MEKLDGEAVEFLESGQIKVKEIHSDNKIIQLNRWFPNGQKERVINFQDGQMSNLDWFHENGQKRISIKNDKSSIANQMPFYNEKGEVEKNSFYLNAKILPMDFILSLPDPMQIKDIERAFGKPEEKKNSMALLKSSDYRYYSIDAQSGDLINKALVTFTTAFDKQGERKISRFTDRLL